jgi:hypothetical protein
LKGDTANWRRSSPEPTRFNEFAASFFQCTYLDFLVFSRTQYVKDIYISVFDSPIVDHFPKNANRNSRPLPKKVLIEIGSHLAFYVHFANRKVALPHIWGTDELITFGEYRLLAKEGATTGTAVVQAWVRGASGGCGASSDGDAKIGLYESRPLVKTTMITANTATTPLAI